MSFEHWLNDGFNMDPTLKLKRNITDNEATMTFDRFTIYGNLSMGHGFAGEFDEFALEYPQSFFTYVCDLFFC